MPGNLQGLTEAAQKAFPDLSDFETLFVKAAALGDVAGAPEGGPTLPVRASLVRWLCGSAARAFVDERGFRLRHARIPDLLDLGSFSVAFPLELTDCDFDGGIRVSRSHLASLRLDGSRIQGLEGDGARLDDDFHVRDATVAGGMRLLNADLGGDLVITGSTVTARPREKPDDEHVAVDLNGAKAAGSVYIDGGFTADGEVRLRGMNIGEGVEAARCHLSNPGGDALGAGRIRAGGNVMLESADVKGEVHLALARIEGDICATGATIRHPGACAMTLTGCVTGADVLLKAGDAPFVAEGYIRMVGTTIGGNLDCTGGRFQGHAVREEKAEAGSSRFALNGSRLTVKGNAFLDGATFVGGLSLVGATVKAELSLTGAQLLLGTPPAASRPWVLLGERLSVEGSAELRAPFRTDGLLGLQLARFGGNLAFGGATFVGGGETGISAEGLRVERQLEWMGITPGEATEVLLDRASVGHLHDTPASWERIARLSLNGLAYGSLCLAGENGWPRRDDQPGYLRRRLEWLRRDHGRFHPRLYDQLSSVLRASGLDDDASQVQIEKGREWRRAWWQARRDRGRDDAGRGMVSGGVPWLLKSYLLDYVLGYGYRPSRAVWWALGVMLLGACVYTRGWEEGLISPEKGRLGADAATVARVDPRARVAGVADSIQARVPRFSPLAYSVDVFLPIVNLHQEDYWHPNASLRCASRLRPVFPHVACGRLLRWYHWTHILVGWLLTTLAVAGFTGLVKRL